MRDTAYTLVGCGTAAVSAEERGGLGGGVEGADMNAGAVW